MALEKNIGSRDAQIRTVLAAVVIVIAFLLENPWVRIVLAVLAAVLATTGYLRTCYLYKLLGKNTAREQPDEHVEDIPPTPTVEGAETNPPDSEKVA